MKIAALHLTNLLEYARLRGSLPENELIQWLPPVAHLKDETLTMEEAGFYKALHLIHRALKDDLWGIKAGNFLTLQLLGLIYQISLQVTTLAEAFYYLHTYLETTLPLVTTRTSITPDQVKITLQIDNKEEEVNRVILENVLSIVSREITMMANQEVLFIITSPYWHALYPAGWEKGEHFTLSFAPVLLKANIRKRDQEQLGILLPEYLRLIEKLKATDNSFANRVKVTILSMSDPHLPDITAVSDALFLTPRSLQRRLERENSSFRELVQELKKQICSFLLRHQEYSIASMSYVLGYAEPASFIHSFKKWFGDSPERIRQSLRNTVS